MNAQALQQLNASIVPGTNGQTWAQWSATPEAQKLSGRDQHNALIRQMNIVNGQDPERGITRGGGGFFQQIPGQSAGETLGTRLAGAAVMGGYVAPALIAGAGTTAAATSPELAAATTSGVVAPAATTAAVAAPVSHALISQGAGQVLAGGLGAGAQIYGAKKQSQANAEALKAQTDANNKALAVAQEQQQYARQQFADYQGRLATYSSLAQPALTRLHDVLGAPGAIPNVRN